MDLQKTSVSIVSFIETDAFLGFNFNSLLFGGSVVEYLSYFRFSLEQRTTSIGIGIGIEQTLRTTRKLPSTEGTR